jgi:hypothetical protein
MQNSETEARFEGRILPAWARAAGLLRCFLYRGDSMTPAFRAGQLLYVRPTARDIRPGDVVVFTDPAGDGYIAHRVVSATDAGLITRGDSAWGDDSLPVARDRVVGRVEVLEDQGLLKAVRGGRSGLWTARIGWGARRVGRWVRRVLGTPYRALGRPPMMRRVLRRCFSRQLRVVHLETPDGPLLKTTYRGRTVARWWPQLNRFECREPYDLILLRPDGPEQGLGPGLGT